MTEAEALAEFVVRASWDDISDAARRQLKIRVLDSIACAVGALEGAPIKLVRQEIDLFGGAELCTMIGGGKTAPDRAAFYNGALVRYLDYNDSYLSGGETCHPSDNLAAVLAGAEYAKGSGKDLLTALAVAYQVQCRLSDVAPVRAKGFDHTTQGSFAVACGLSKALGLSAERTANAIAICGTAFNALRITRTGLLSNWKGLAYPNTTFGCTHGTFLAAQGITGPLGVFEGNKGFKEAIAGPFEIDWSLEDLERVKLTILKKYNAEVHSQATLEGALELKQEHGFAAESVDAVDVETFDVAYNIIGGGEEGNKYVVHTKEEADHSLQYMVAVAILDGEVTPAQYAPERIERKDVQDLLRRVVVQPSEAFSRRFPDEMPCRITVRLRDGRELVKQKSDYEGFYTNPMRWETIVQKLDSLTSPYADAALRKQIVDAVFDLDEIQVADLVRLLARVGRPAATEEVRAA